MWSGLSDCGIDVWCGDGAARLRGGMPAGENEWQVNLEPVLVEIVDSKSAHAVDSLQEHNPGRSEA